MASRAGRKGVSLPSCPLRIGPEPRCPRPGPARLASQPRFRHGRSVRKTDRPPQARFNAGSAPPMGLDGTGASPVAGPGGGSLRIHRPPAEPRWRIASPGLAPHVQALPPGPPSRLVRNVREPSGRREHTKYPIEPKGGDEIADRARQVPGIADETVPACPRPGGSSAWRPAPPPTRITSADAWLSGLPSRERQGGCPSVFDFRSCTEDSGRAEASKATKNNPWKRQGRRRKVGGPSFHSSINSAPASAYPVPASAYRSPLPHTRPRWLSRPPLRHPRA